jgi:UDP-glucose:(heptosyl)LPS alpha-1,3-glucosyltransferase
MLLGFCIYKYFPYGGIQRDLRKIIAACVARGHEARVYALSWDGPQPEDCELVIVPVQAVTNHHRYELYAQWVHDHLRSHPVALLVGMNKMPGLDVYYAGDSCFEEKAQTQRSAAYRLLPRYRHFAGAERAVFDPAAGTQILTISDQQTPFFRKHYQTHPSRFHPLPPGIERDRVLSGLDAKAQAQDSARLREELGLVEDERMLLFVGSGFVKKGLDRALTALHALPRQIYRQTRLVVIGRDNAEPFRRMARRLGVADRVLFFADGRPDVPRFLHAADALVLPAYDENAGMVILEAMIAGLPVLTTSNCGYAHYVSDHGAGLLASYPFSQDDFNELLVQILTSDERDAWAAAGRALADDPVIFRLADTAADLIEGFAAARPRTLAFALFKYFPYGGLQRDFMQVAKLALARGYRVRVYTLSWEAELADDFENSPDFHLQQIDVPGVLNHVRYRQFARAMAAHLAQFPVDCVIGFNKMPGLDAYYAADSCFEHKAQTLRPAYYRRTSRYRLFSDFERAVFDPTATTQIYLITETQRKEFVAHYGTPDQRMRLLPPSVSADRRRGDDWRTVRRVFREDFGYDQDTLLLLQVGSGFVTKGVDRTILALASLPRALRDRTRLMVVGQDNPRAFESLADESGVADRLQIFSGRDDIPRFLQGADLMVHPAVLESGGIVLLEALIAGLPVITSASCGFAHYVDTAGGGEVLPEPFAQPVLNARLAALLADADLRQRYSNAGVDFAAQAGRFNMPEQFLGSIEERFFA